MIVLGSLLSWISGLTVFSAMVMLLFIAAPIASPRSYDGLAKLLCRLLIRCFRISVRVEGLEQLDRGRTYLFVANHVNILDGFLLYGHLPWFFRALELEEHFAWPVYGWLIRTFGNLPLDPGGGARTAVGLRRAERALRNGTSILVLPEGHRTRDGRMGAFGRGAFRVAQQARAELAPVVMAGAFRVMRTGRWTVTPGTVRLVVGKPFRAGECRALDTTALRDATRERMQRMLLAAHERARALHHRLRLAT